MELVNKLLSLEFSCIDIDDEARVLYNASIYPMDKDMNTMDPSYIMENSTFLNLKIDFVSNRTIKALETYKKEINVMNHHLFIHSILLDILTFFIITKNPFKKKTDTKEHAIKRLHFLAEHTLGCSDNSIKDELNREIEKITLAS